MANYEVGYGKPPKASQFPAGKSGNPKGRPKGVKSAAAIVQEIFLKPVTVTQNGKPTKMTTIGALLCRVVATASKGDLKALKLAWDIFSKSIGTTDPSSIADLMGSQAPFELTAEEMASISKLKLLKGVS